MYEFQMIEHCQAEADCTAPIIIVGPGRSGTTLLTGLLKEHPDVLPLGETTFLVQALWSDIKERFPRGIPAQVKQSRDDWAAMSLRDYRRDVLKSEEARHAAATRDVFAQLVDHETARREALLGRFFFELMCPPPSRRPRWCFQEIWAGRDTFPYTWELYERIFPNALYIQSIRHPFEYLKSYLAREDVATQTPEGVSYILTQWVQMMHNNMALATTGRYYRYRLEDLVDSREEVFEEICAFLKLRRHPPCLKAMKLTFGGKNKREVDIDPRVLDEAPGVRALMDELGYE